MTYYSTAMAHALTGRNSSIMPCPECRSKGREGNAKMGNRRSRCSMCNRYAQAVMRQVRVRVRDRLGDEYIEIMNQVERDIYPGFVDEWMRAHSEDPA